MRSTLERLIGNGKNIDSLAVRSLLLLYEDEIIALGDCCVRFDKLRYFHSYFKNAKVAINFTNKKNLKFADGFLKNNPYIEKYSNLAWADIDFRDYDLVFCITSDEPAFLSYLDQEYGSDIESGELRLAVFSISKLIIKPQIGVRYVFPVIGELEAYIRAPRPGELYLSDAERNWGDRWLEERGLKENEDLYIIVDSSAVRSKILAMPVHLEMIRNFVAKPNTRLLIFDEKGLGKEEFYRKCLGDAAVSRMIFSRKLSLREDLCLLASRYTRLILGPCTGLMHCSSSIYNHYVAGGMPQWTAPAIVVYTGRYDKDNYNVDVWWGSSPLVTCLLLLPGQGRKEIVRLTDLPAAQRKENNSLPCSEYTAPQLIGLIDRLMAARCQAV